LSVRLPSVLIVFALAVTVPAQATLAQYLDAHPAPGTFTLAPEATRSKGAGTQLADFDRQMVKIGTLAVVAPTTMVQFTDEPKDPPNFYDGLPRDAKVILLMTTLSRGQMQVATSRGLGLTDLNPAQRPVFLSLLPSELRWQTVRYGEDRDSEVLEKGELSGAQMRQLRLKLERRLSLRVYMQDTPNAFSYLDPEDFDQDRGTTKTLRDNMAEQKADDSFGSQVRRVVPNRPKPGDLDVSRLGTPVSLDGATTVADLLAKVGHRTGLRIAADARVRSISVRCSAASAPAGELLTATALCLGGTYRRIGNTYLLAADRVGAGTRIPRWAQWKEAADKKTWEARMGWQQGLGKSGLLDVLAYDSGDRHAPSEALLKRIDAPPADPNGQGPNITWDELTPELRESMNKWATMYKSQPIRQDGVGAEVHFKYRFVLPNGRMCQPEGYLGQESLYRPRQAYVEPALPDLPLGKVAAGSTLSVLAPNAADAELAVATAKRFGFGRLMIETEDRAALQTAVGSGLPTTLMIRPWRLLRSSPEEDRTLLGDTAPQARERLLPNLSYIPTTTVWTATDSGLRSPFDPSLSRHWNMLVELARTPGLAGLAVADHQPQGYEVESVGSQIGGYSAALSELWAFGYTERARLGFLERTGIDPVDILPTQVHFPTVMFSPFFPERRGDVRMDRVEATWVTYRHDACSKAILGFLKRLPPVPISIEVARQYRHQPPLDAPVLAPFSPNDGLPRYYDQFVHEIPGASSMFIVPVSGEGSDERTQRMLKLQLGPNPRPFTIHLGLRPPSDWERFLKGVWETVEGAGGPAPR
jgi:hypothetical protein